jgi:mono/diheme cytochrome c family protein
VKRFLGVAAAGIAAAAGVFAVAVVAQSQEYTGRQLYELHGCIGCHLADGSGGVGPALAGNQRLADEPFVIQQILQGGEGMPGYGVQFSNEQVARVASYVRTSWGNDFGEVKPKQVRQLRQGQDDKGHGQTGNEKREQSQGNPSGQVPSAAEEPETGGHAWTRSHAVIEEPATILGGPLRVQVQSRPGEQRALWIGPGPRRLDPHVFGTPDKPLAYYPGPWPLYGVPVDKRAVNEAGERFTTTTEPTPYSDDAQETTGSVSMTLLDATATDAAVTRDEIDFEMTFSSPDGAHEYAVRVEKALPHGDAHPNFGGVATNVLLHGISGVGTPMLPTEFSYAAFWGTGTVSRDGEVVNEDQLVHVMVTEPVRDASHRLVTDGSIPAPGAGPTEKTLQLLVAPYRVDPDRQFALQEAPVKTGVMVDSPQGNTEQGFLHVTIGEIDVMAGGEGEVGPGRQQGRQEQPGKAEQTEQREEGDQQAGAKDEPLKTGGHAWVQSHAKIQNPAAILGGPLTVNVRNQPNRDTAFWIYPGPRKLDPHVFGTPDKPLAYYPAPFPLYGVPVDKRGVNEAGDAFTKTTEPTPFSNKWQGTSGSVSMTVRDSTATDAAVSDDEVEFEMTFESPDGAHEYTVTVKKALPHGSAYPFFGGVATNFVHHGFIGVGTTLMPTMFTYAAFWGVGTVSRDGQVVNESQLVHVMITEPVRGPEYLLATDGNVPSSIASPQDSTLHLMVPAYKVKPGQQPPLEKSPVKTGVMVDSPQGKTEQPFFHVMINELELTAARGDTVAAAQEQRQEGQPGQEQSAGQSQGERIFHDNCAVCHGAQGQGGIGPMLAADNVLGDTRYVINQILHGGGGMPGFAERLSDDQIAAVATHERTSWGNDFGEVTAEQVAQQRQGQQQAQRQPGGQQQEGQQGQKQGEDGEEARRQLGEQLYANVGCAGCHSSKGAGGVGPKLSNNPRLQDAEYVVFKILEGGEGMPGWADKLTREQVAAIASYVRTSWGNEFGPVAPEQAARQPARLEGAQREDGQKHEEGSEQEGAGPEVTVSLAEWVILMPSQLEAGPVTFVVTNDGTVEHSLRIEGETVDEGFESNLRPQESRRLTVELQPGTYRVYSPIDDHAQRGMELQLVVTGSQQ